MKKILCLAVLVGILGASDNTNKLKEECLNGSNTSNGVSCYSLGIEYITKQNPTKQDYQNAVEYFQKSCDIGVTFACDELGQLYEKGLGVEKDIKKAENLYIKACDDKETTLNGVPASAAGCYSLGWLYQDKKKSTEHFEKSCSYGNYTGCALAGISYNNGDGVKQNYKKASELFKKACDSNVAIAKEIGCHELGFLYYSGKGVRQSKTIAKEYFGKACDAGSQNGCDNYKQLNK